MIRKSFLVAFCMAFLTSVFASPSHNYPETDSARALQQSKPMTAPNYCEIEINNYSFHDVQVFGVFDTGVALTPFIIHSFESPHYISLFYFGYCHAGMNIHINTYAGDVVYSAYTIPHTIIRITPFMANHTSSN